jgi:GDPmannose 4,6-dehydratase
VTAAPRALVTGVTGQDGWYLSQLLRADGYEVAGLVHHDDQTDVPPGVTGIRGDLADSASVQAAVDIAEADEIYNLAGISSVAQSWQIPTLTADVTGLGLLRLIEAVRSRAERTGTCARIVQASSAEIFGHAEPPQSETTPLAPATPYGAAKAFAHQIAAVYRGTGMPISTAILYNHESPRRPDGFVTRRITRGVALIARGQADRLRLGNLDSKRDWGYAGDYARALTLIARYRDADDFVIATGESRTVADFVAAAFAHVGITDWQRLVEIDPEFVRPADPGEQRGDASKARAVLGWQPSTSFAELVAEMVDADLALLD